jgi:RNA polymerase sigma-70 factor (ECF subfamily)
MTTLAARDRGATARPSVAAPAPAVTRLAAVAHAHIDFVWRVLRRHGLSPADADDGVQRVFLLFREKADGVAEGAEKGFLFRVATFVAKELRRGSDRFEEPTDANLSAVPSPSARVEAEDLLDKVMRRLDDDERAAFLLFEIEGLTMVEIGRILGWPQGTVASRLRRARDKVKAAAAQMNAEGEAT